MPRINVVDRFFTDPRVEAMGEEFGEYKAMGRCLKAWRIAQDYVPGAVPNNVARYKKDLFASLIKYDLAEEKEGGGVYVYGADEHFNWLVINRKNAKKGGMAKAASGVPKTHLGTPKADSGVPYNSYSNSNSISNSNSNSKKGRALEKTNAPVLEKKFKERHLLFAQKWLDAFFKGTQERKEGVDLDKWANQVRLAEKDGFDLDAIFDFCKTGWWAESGNCQSFPRMRAKKGDLCKLDTITGQLGTKPMTLAQSIESQKKEAATRIYVSKKPEGSPF